MKHTLFIIAIALCTITTTAKTTILCKEQTHSNAGNMHKPFIHTRMYATDMAIAFTQLPLRASCVYVLDEQGTVATSRKVSRKNNKVNIKQLKPGVYTIVLKQGNKTKMYGYISGVVLKTRRATPLINPDMLAMFSL